MARKRKASELKASNSEGSSAYKKSTSSAARADSQRTKVDWSTIDQGENFDGFKLSAVKLKPKKEATKPASKKQRTAHKSSRASEIYRDAPLDAEVSQVNPYPETDLSEIYCKIEPAREWESTQRYRKFTISGEGFEVNQFVFLKKEPEEQDTSTAIQHWVAKVLEVRAGDPQHVYLRIYWAYRPEDLPGGRQPHHGECELIVSNHMDIVDAQCVQGSADVIYWDDSPDNTNFPAPEQLYWRQALDINKRKGSQFTKLNTYCIDKKPSNPDEPLLQCHSCSGYLHARCLEERAVENTHVKHNTKNSTGSTKRRHMWKGFFSAQLSITDTNSPHLTVTDKRNGKKNEAWDVDIYCLLCKSHFAKAYATAPIPKTPAAQIVDDDEVEEEEEDAAVTPEVSTPAAAPLDEANLAIGDIPTTATAAPAATQAARGKGRPKGSKNKTRGRRPKIKQENVSEQVTSLMREDEQIKEEEQVVKRETVEKEIVAQVTPLPAPAPASVFHSGVRSVKRLLWRS